MQKGKGRTDRTSKGKSPWKDRALWNRQRCLRVTYPKAEQNLEIEGMWKEVLAWKQVKWKIHDLTMRRVGAKVTWKSRCRRGKTLRGNGLARTPVSNSPIPGNGRWKVKRSENARNPKIGSRVQQTCNPEAEKTIEVVRNHEGGTKLETSVVSGSNIHRRMDGEWTRQGTSMEGENDRSRRPTREKSGRSLREEGSKAPRGAMGEPGMNRSATRTTPGGRAHRKV